MEFLRILLNGMSIESRKIMNTVPYIELSLIGIDKYEEEIKFH